MTNFKTDRTMKTIKIFSAALFVLVAAACNTDYLSENMSNLEPMTIAGTKTKTILNQADGSVSWTAGDQIAIYDDQDGEQHIFTNTSDKVSSFTGMVTARTEQFWGVYPTDLITDFNNGKVTMTLPPDQTPVAGTFAEELNISVTSGAKTPGTELVEGVSFHNACGLISFTVPKNIAAKKVTFVSDNSFLCGTLSVDCTTSKAVLSSNQSNSVFMEGEFEAGSTFYFVVAPGQIEGFIINVETEKGSYYSKRASKGKINVTAGSLTRLGQISFKAGAVTASAEHVYDEDGVLTGSSLTVNHGIPQNMWKDVTRLNVTVTKGGTPYREYSREYSAESLSAATVVPIGEKNYLPAGSYDVNVTYTMNKEETTIKGTANVPEPDKNKFKLTITSVDATTSYSLAKKGEIEKANNHEADQITSPKAVFAGISAAVLNELQPTCSFSVSGKTNQGTVSGTNISCDKFTGLTWGSHTLTATVTFDGVSSSATTECHITGLPYSVSLTSQPSGWTFGGSISWEGYGWNKGDGAKYLRLRGAADYASRGRALTPAFNFSCGASEIKVKTTADCFHYASSGSANNIYINANTSSCGEKTSNGTSIKNGTTFNNFNGVNDVVNYLTLTPSTPHISITTNVPKEGARTDFIGVQSIRVDYN